MKNSIVLLIAFALLVSISTQTSVETEAKITKGSSKILDMFTFGWPAWAQVLIGLSTGTAFQALRLFLPFDCVRAGFDMTLNGMDFLVFYQQMIHDDYTKNSWYVIMQLLAIGMGVPYMFMICPKNNLDF